MDKIITLMLFSMIITGCAGWHAIPPNGYTTEVEDSSDTIRIAFDQRGDLHPLSAPADMPTNTPWKIFGEVVSVRKHMLKNPALEYSDETIEKQYKDMAALINRKLKALGDDTKLVFLIHGYNNSFGFAHKGFTAMRQQVNSLGGKYLFVEVYWDGLYQRWYTPPLTYWFKAMTYSNYAGQFGLRRLISSLSGIPEITVMTHSRGAAVAYSAFADPVYDPDLGKHLPIPKFHNDDLKKVNLLLVAPAVGDGHKFEELPATEDQLFNVWIGFNRSDEKLKKRIKNYEVGASKMGSTELGVIDSYYQKQKGLITNPNINFERVEYCSIQHGIADYMKADTPTKCLLSSAIQRPNLIECARVNPCLEQ